MISLRTLFRWHLWLGLISGLFMFVICLTGAIAVFAQEIDWLVIPPLRVNPPTGGIGAGEDAVVASVLAAYPSARITTLTRSTRPRFAHIVAIEIRGASQSGRLDVYVNPYTAVIQGARAAGGGYFSSVYQFLRQTHVRLLMGLWGRVFVGVCGVSLVLSCLTGLWIYRGWIRKMFTLPLGRGWGHRRPWAELHKFIGAWSLLFNILIGLTGAALGLENLVNQIDQKWMSPAAQKSAQTNKEPGPVPIPLRPAVAADMLPVKTLLAKAKEAFPDFTPRVIVFPARAGGPVLLRGEVPGVLVAQSHVRTANSITLDSTTGAVLRLVDGRQTKGWTRVYWAIDPLHFGYFGGLPIKLIWFILGLTPCVLSIAGTIMWWRRRARASTHTVPSISTPPAAIRWITLAATFITLTLAYSIVGYALKSWSFNDRFMELWVVKPISLALCAFPVTAALIWVAARLRARPWAYGITCVLIGSWYLALTRILIP